MSDAEKIARASVETCNEWEALCAKKDAEIQRLRQTLTLAEHKIVQYLRGQYSDGVSLRSTMAAIRAALNPPEQASSACVHRRHAECHFAACVCECHNPPQQKGTSDEK